MQWLREECGRDYCYCTALTRLMQMMVHQSFWSGPSGTATNRSIRDGTKYYRGRKLFDIDISIVKAQRIEQHTPQGKGWFDGACRQVAWLVLIENRQIWW